MGCQLSDAVPSDGPAAVLAAVGAGNVLRIIGDSLSSDHYASFVGCHLSCSAQGAVQLPCQRDAPGGQGAPLPMFGNGTRRCNAPESIPRQLIFNFAGSLRWDWRQAILDAGFNPRVADRTMRSWHESCGSEVPTSGCSTAVGQASQFHPNGTLIRATGTAHVDFRRVNLFPVSEQETRALLHLLLYVGPVKLGFNDTVVMSMGLHYNSAAVLEGAMRNVLRWWAAERAAGRAPRLLWRQTSPQHFATSDGRFSSYRDLVTTRQCQANLTAAQVAENYPDYNFTRAFRSYHRWFQVLPTFAPSLDRHDEHSRLQAGSTSLSEKATGDLFRAANESRKAVRPDCTHFCMSSSTIRFWTQAMLSWIRSLREAEHHHA